MLKKVSHKRPYVAPDIKRVEVTAVGKHAVYDVLTAGEVGPDLDVADLLSQYGSPLYIVSERELRQLYRDFAQHFTLPGFNTVVGYSYKTNYLPAICATLHQEGAWAEVVSGMEYSLARALGVPGAEIIFNGPMKSDDELRLAVTEGALINVDNREELERLAEVAEALDCRARVGLRINFQYGANPWTKFGFSFEEGEAEAAIQMVAEASHLDLKALHNHAGTFQLDAHVYGRAVEVLLDCVKLAKDLGEAVEIIDLGGGYPSQNALRPEYALNGVTRPSHNPLAVFAQVIGDALAKGRDLFDVTPTLILEPGRALVDQACSLACSVVAVKEIANQGRGIIVDAGVHLLPTARWYNHDVDQAAAEAGTLGQGPGEAATLYGCLCMQIDVLRERALLPKVQAGDPLIVHNVGAYCLTQSMQFIQPRPATVMVTAQGVEVIRRAETWRDIFALDRVPNHLRLPGHAF